MNKEELEQISADLEATADYLEKYGRIKGSLIEQELPPDSEVYGVPACLKGASQITIGYSFQIHHDSCEACGCHSHIASIHADASRCARHNNAMKFLGDRLFAGGYYNDDPVTWNDVPDTTDQMVQDELRQAAKDARIKAEQS